MPAAKCARPSSCSSPRRASRRSRAQRGFHPPRPEQQVERVGCAVDHYVGSDDGLARGALLLDDCYAEACAALYESPKRPVVLSFMAGMGGEAIVLKEFYWMTNKMLEAQKRGGIEKRTHWVGFEE